MTIAQTILQQLGGGRFIAMTGARNFIASEASDGRGLLRFAVPRIGIVTITLTAMDDYIVRIIAPRTGAEKAMREGVYADNLQAVFSKMTGLATRLF